MFEVIFSLFSFADYKEPVRSRDGQPASTLDKLNTHQHVQTKQGHLKVTPNKSSYSVHSVEKAPVV